MNWKLSVSLGAALAAGLSLAAVVLVQHGRTPSDAVDERTAADAREPVIAAVARRIAEEAEGAAPPPAVQAAPIPPAEVLAVAGRADRLAGLPEGYSPVRFGGEMDKAPSSGPVSDANDRSVRMPDWLGSPNGVDALAAQAAANGRGWSFGWIGLSAGARRAELEAALEGADGEVVGGAGRLLRARLPGDEAQLAAIARLPGVDAVGAMPAAAKLRAFDGDPNAVSDRDATPVFVTLMADDADGRWKRELTSLGAVVGRYDPQIRVYAANATRAVLEALAAADFVLGVEPVGLVEAAHDTSIPAMGADALRTWTGRGVFSGVGGASVPVGVMDSGLNVRHADIAEHRTSICGSNFVAGDARAQDADLWIDAYGHGTHVTGTIVGNGFLSGALAGMAPSVQHVRIAKVLHSEGGGSVAGWLRAMDWLGTASACDGSEDVRPLVVNMSMAIPGDLRQGRAVHARKLDAMVWDRRQLYVVGLANEAASAFSSPGAAKNSLVVGATYDSGAHAAFSSHGPTADGRLAPHVVVPGVDVCSARGGGAAGGYECESGTSTASPMVAGAAALLMDASPGYAERPALVRARLMASAIRPDAWLDEPGAFASDNSAGPTGLQARYGLGKVSARTAVLERNAPDGWTSGGATVEFADNGTYAYEDIEVPEGAARLDVVLTWDEPPVDAVAGSVLNDLDLWLDAGADCGDGACGERSSTSRIDNVEWVIVRNPAPGTWRLKTVGRRVYTDARAAVAWTVIRGASTPQLAVDAGEPVERTATGGERKVELGLSVTVDSYVAAGAAVHFECRGEGDDCGAPGLRIEVADVAREDGLATAAGAGESPQRSTAVPLGRRIAISEIAAGEVQELELDVTYSGTKPVRLHYAASSWNAHGAAGSVVVRPAGSADDAPAAHTPTNDEFAHATVIEDDEGSVSVELAGATPEPGEPPASTAAAGLVEVENRWHERPLGSVWYRWTAPANGLARFWLVAEPGPRGSESLDVFTGETPAALTPVASNHRGERAPIYSSPGILSGYDEKIATVQSAAFFAEQGETYRVRIANSERSSRSLTLRWYQGDRPANDDFESAFELAGADGEREGTNAGATLEAGESFGSLAATTWHRWTAPADGAWRFAVDGADLRLAVLTGEAVRDLRLVSGFPATEAAFRTRSGQVYRIAVAASDAFVPGSEYTLSWAETTWEPSGSDNFADRTTVAGASGLEARVVDRSATVEPGEPPETGVRTSWWSWTAPASGNYTWRLDPLAGEWPVAAAFAGDALDGLQLVGSTTGGQSAGREFSFPANAGTTYAFSLGWPAGDVGAYVFPTTTGRVSWGPAPENDERLRAIVLGSTRGSTAANDAYATTGSGELDDLLGDRSVWWTWEAPTGGWYTFDTGSAARYLAVYEDGSARPVSHSRTPDGEVTFRAVAGRSYTIRVGSPAWSADGSFALAWGRAEAPPAWLAFQGAYADAPDPRGRAVRLMDAGSLAFHGDTLYAVSTLGLTAFERDAATGSLNGVRSIEDDLLGSVLAADPVRNRLIANRCGTWRVYTGLDDTTTMIGDDLPVEGDPANCARRLFMEPAGAFLYLVAPETGIDVFAVEDDGALRHEATTRLVGIKDAVIARNGEFVYAADLDGTTYLRTFARDGDSGMLTQRDRSLHYRSARDMDNLAISGDDLLFVTRTSSGLTYMYELVDGVLTRPSIWISLVDNTDLPVELARPFEFTSARPETTAVDVFGTSVAAGLEIRQDQIDLMAAGGADRAGNRTPLFGSPNGLASSPDGRHVYVATYEHGIVAFERVGAGVEPRDPHVRLDLLEVSPGAISFGGETGSDGCIAVDGLEHDGAVYTVRSAKWQRRPNADWDWADVAGTVASGQFCPHTPDRPGHYRLVADMEVDGETGWHTSNTLVVGDHGNSREGATPVGAPSATEGWLEPDDQDFFRIDLAQSGTLTVYSEGWIDTVGSLLDADGAAMASDDNGGGDRNFRISRDVDAGTYYMRTHGSSGAIGGYTLQVEFEPEPSAVLAVESATLSAEPAVGKTFTLHVVVRNNGNAESEATTVRYYRSDDDTISGEDDEIGTGEVAALSTGESSEHSMEVTVAEAGSYSYGACVDRVGSETDTHDNCSAAVSEPIAGFELDATTYRVGEGIAHAGGLLYVPVRGHRRIYVYTIAGEPRSDLDFELDAENSTPSAIVHVDGLLYVADKDGGIYVYTTSGDRRADYDFELDAETRSTGLSGIAHTDGLLYVVRHLNTRVQVYTTSGGRCAGADFDLDPANARPGAIAHAGGLLYVQDSIFGARHKVYAYATSSGERQTGAEFELDPENGATSGIDYAAGRFYVVDTARGVFVYTGDGGGDHGDTFAAATAVAVPSSTEGDLEEGGDKDYFRLRVARATWLTIETTGNTDTYGTLFNDLRWSLETDDDAGPERNFRIHRYVHAGMYYVEVRGDGPSTTGSYELNVSTTGGDGSRQDLDGLSTPTPWHMTNVRFDFPDAPEDIDSYCVTFSLDADVPDDVNLYIAPFNQTFNKVGFYGGIQTRIDGHEGKRDSARFVQRGRGAIFSRWSERAWGAIEQAPGGLVESSDHEGDFIGVRNDFSWREGSYELCLRKAAVVEGDPLPDDYELEDIAYGWGRFVHTWVRMELTDVASGDTTFVGALAFPGRTVSMRRSNVIFVEIYGNPSPFPAADVPQFTVSFENFQVDGEDLPYGRVIDVSNPIPSDSAQIPKLAYASYDAGRGVVNIEVGRFAGEFGRVGTVVKRKTPDPTAACSGTGDADTGAAPTGGRLSSYLVDAWAGDRFFRGAWFVPPLAL